MVSLEKFLTKLPKLCCKERQSDMKGTYHLFGLYAHGKMWDHQGFSTDAYLHTLPQRVGVLSAKSPCYLVVHCAGTESALTRTTTTKSIPETTSLACETTSAASCGSRAKSQRCAQAHGARVVGESCNIKYKMKEFDPRRWHASSKLAAARIVVSAFTSRAVDVVSQGTLRELGKYWDLSCPRTTPSTCFLVCVRGR